MKSPNQVLSFAFGITLAMLVAISLMTALELSWGKAALCQEILEQTNAAGRWGHDQSGDGISLHAVVTKKLCVTGQGACPNGAAVR